jgi:hypothetical protein
MNLVAYEYIATQVGKFGTLILSKFAGAAQSLNGNYPKANLLIQNMFRCDFDQSLEYK